MKNSNNLNHLAVKVENSIGRLIAEKTSNTRSEFQRDRDRIIHSTAFRRLKHKTQVFVSHEGDHYRTRLTHSLEVSQIARSIAKIFCLNEELTETLALAHDIGHPPFGHAGEDALKIAMKNHHGFDHNDQAIRIVHQLEKKYFDFDGLNLTWESLEGLVKHNGPLVRSIPPAIKSLNDEFDLKLMNHSSLEAQVAAIADDIAYNNHDIDDGFRSGLLSIEALMTNALFKLCAEDVRSTFAKINDEIFINEVVRRMINWMVSDLITTSKENILKFNPSSLEEVRTMPSLVKFSSDFFKSKQEIKTYIRKSLYEHKQVKDMTNNAQHMIKTLYDYFIDDTKRISKDFKKDTTDAFERTVLDYIGGMTGRFGIPITNKIQ